MKKNGKMLSGLLLAGMMTLSLTACGGGGPKGTYDLESVTSQGITMDMDQLEEMTGMDTDMYITFNKDGTGFLELGFDSTEFNWDDDTLEVDGDTTGYTCKGSTIVVEIDGDTLTFSK